MENKILLAREEKKIFINQYLKEFDVVILKGNIPGLNKNIVLLPLLLQPVHFEIMKLDPKSISFHESSDGNFYCYLFNKGQNLKEKTIEIEEKHPLGRFVDIDVYQGITSISRNTLRKCFICNNAAFVCQRNKTHTLDELLMKMENACYSFYETFFKSVVYESMMKELNLDLKFGLVTKSSNGSHNDMNYELMNRAAKVISKEFFNIFLEGVKGNSETDTFMRIRPIGQSIENKMYEVTNHVNCYKGLIFDLGIILCALGIKISKRRDDSLFDIIRLMCKDLEKEIVESPPSFGKEAYLKYGFLGARGEAKNGFINVEKLLNKYPFVGEDVVLRQMLIELIQNTEDTCLLKRAKSISCYNEVKEKFKNCTDILELNDYCISKNLSFGGSADLLICTIFLDKIDKSLIKIRK